MKYQTTADLRQVGQEISGDSMKLYTVRVGTNDNAQAAYADVDTGSKSTLPYLRARLDA